MKKPRIRIVKKEKDGVTFTIYKGSKETKISWEDLNKNFIQDDEKGFWYVMTDEYHKLCTRMNEQLSSMAGKVFLARKSSKPEASLNIMAMLGAESQKFCKEFNCTVPELIVMIESTLSQMAENTMKSFNGGGERRSSKPKRKDVEKSSNEECSSSIGEILKAKNIKL